MVVEIVGNQIRLRLESPSKFKQFKTFDPGEPGKLQIILGYDGKEWKRQAYRINLDNYSELSDVIYEIERLYTTQSNKQKAIKLAKKYFE